MEEAQLVWLKDKNSNQLGANGNPSDRLYGEGSMPVLPDYIIQDYGYIANAPQADYPLYNLNYRNGPIYQIVQANKTGSDWFHKIFIPALNQNHTVSISGANEHNRYLLSLGYLNQQGTLLYTYLKRYTLRVNTEFSVKNKIRIGENMQMSYRDNLIAPNQSGGANQSGLNPIANVTSVSSLLPVFDIKGNWATFGNPYSGFAENPVAQRVMTKNNIDNNWRIFGNIYAETNFLKYFTARTSFGGTVNNYYSRYYYYDSFQPPFPELGPNNSLTEKAAFQTSWTWTNTVNFAAIFAKNHSIKVLTGAEAISNYSREADASRAGFFTDDHNYTTLSNGRYCIINSGFATQSALFSLFGRNDYSFKEKYFLTGTLRRDGSSVFGPKNRYGWFPSIGVAWRLSQEKFMDKYKWINELKLRVSHGISGYDRNVDPANQFTLFATSAGRSYYDISGTSTRPVAGFYRARIGNAETGWQQDIVTNIGWDGIFWNGKFSITADWYKKQSSGLLFPSNLSAVIAGDAVSTNYKYWQCAEQRN